jgi:Rrf2 family iron-sulfur cluster assembly transcriptional regulator
VKEKTMKITALEEYGVRCLLQLARADDPYGLTIQQIADAENMSFAYAAKLLRLLRLGGLIRSCRNPRLGGGYILARPAAEVRLGEVMRVLSEPLFEEPGFCERHASPDMTGACVHNSDCTLRVIWQTLEAGIRRFLDRITLADLLQGPEQIAQRLGGQLDAETLGPPGGLLTLGSAVRS